MRRKRGRLTLREEQFAKLVALEDCSLVGAFRLAYPSRNGPRSPGGERVDARRIAHRPLVEQRIEELRNQLRAGDPVELRRRANAVLGGILAQELDPRYRRAALDTLRYLDAQEWAEQKAERESLRMAMAELALLDAIEGRGAGGRSRVRQRLEELHRKAEEQTGGTSLYDQIGAKPEIGVDPDSDRRRAEIDQVVADRRRMRFGGGL